MTPPEDLWRKDCEAAQEDRDEFEQQLGEIRELAMDLIAHLLYAECGHCGLPEPERTACGCDHCSAIGQRTAALRDALKRPPSTPQSDNQEEQQGAEVGEGPKRIFYCNKCGYRGATSAHVSHTGCTYLAAPTQPKADPEVPLFDRDALCGDGIQSSGLLGEAATDLSDYAAEREDPDDERRLLGMSKELRALRDQLAQPDCQSTPELLGEWVGDGWSAPAEAIDAAWRAVESLEGVPPIHRNVLALAVSVALLTQQPVSESPGDSGVGLEAVDGLPSPEKRQRHLLDVVRNVCGGDAAREALGGRYHGEMPFDESARDEEHEDTVALRKAEAQARADLDRFAADLTQPVPGNSGGVEEGEWQKPTLSMLVAATIQRARGFEDEARPLANMLPNGVNDDRIFEARGMQKVAENLRELLEEPTAAPTQPPSPGGRAMKLDATGVNEFGVQMCVCGNKRVHAWEPGESCSPQLVVPAAASDPDPDPVTGKQSPAEPQGDVEAVEAWAKRQHEDLREVNGELPLWRELLDPWRSNSLEEAREDLEAITPLLYKQWRSSYEGELLGEAEQLEKPPTDIASGSTVHAIRVAKAQGIRDAVAALNKEKADA